MPKGDYMDYDKGGYINPKYAAEGATKKKYGGNEAIHDGVVMKSKSRAAGENLSYTEGYASFAEDEGTSPSVYEKGKQRK